MPEDRAGFREPFDHLSMPCLLYSGSEDDIANELPHAVELLPHATLVLIEGLDHMQTFLSHDAVLPHVTTFLRQVDPAPVG